MAYRTNPFLERTSERTTSDEDFVRLFSPKILERLSDDAFEGAVHLFTSPPGGGKTTLLRALTPPALRAFCNNKIRRTFRSTTDINEAYLRLVDREVISEQDGPQLLGVLISCAHGYADLPPGTSTAQDGLFRALFDSRVVVRTLRSLATLLGYSSIDQLSSIKLEYSEDAKDLKSIPLLPSVGELFGWAEELEKSVYAKLDSVLNTDFEGMPAHIRFEGLLWLQCVKFFKDETEIAPKRLLMVDDLHALRKRQRNLIMEFVELRPVVPVWLAERSIALGSGLISQGAREGRDLRHYSLEDIWSGPKGQHQFNAFAQNILDRRLEVQREIPGGAFSQYLSDQIQPEQLREQFEKGAALFRAEMREHPNNERYSRWTARIEKDLENLSFETLRDMYVARILVARDQTKRQMTLSLEPLSEEELEERDNSATQNAAEIFLHEELQVPYYFGIDRLCALGSSNVEEVLYLAASLYEGMLAKQVLRRQSDAQLSAQDQERRIKEAAKKRRDFIQKNHTEGSRAKRLLDAIGIFCRSKTFEPNAPIAPGVTGIRLSQIELDGMIPAVTQSKAGEILHKVLSECVAENLLIIRASATSASRGAGTVFYLNRMLCAHYDLPLGFGGWQEVSSETLIDWMERGHQPSRQRKLGA